MNGRTLLLLIGVGALGLALLEMASPRLLRPPLDANLLTALGVLLLIYAYFVVEARDEVDVVRTPTPDPEIPARTPIPGEDLAVVLRSFLDAPSNPDDLAVEGLRAAAFAVLTRYEGLSTSAARDRLATGAWTDDPGAASLFADDPVSLPPSDRVRAFLAPQVARRRAIRHAVDAIAARADVAVPAPTLRDRVADWKAGLLGADYVATPGRPGNGKEHVSSTEFTDAVTGPAAGFDGEPRPTYHWFGVGLVALVSLGVGLLLERPSILLAGIVGLGFVAYARSAALGPLALAVERTVEPAHPRPGETVSVTVTVTNEGRRPIPDLRVVDGVPTMLAVTDGSPRHGTPLRPGNSASFTYDIEAARGRHTFDPLLAIARDLPGATERAIHIATDTTITCVPSLRSLRGPFPLRELAAGHVGTVAADTGGSGLEFHATRRYRPGDPMNRIDWHRYARTGSLSTREFREERAATIVVVVDVLSGAYVSPERWADHAVDRSIEAAGRLFSTLLDAGHRVGIATVGPAECWLPPGAGRDHRVRGRTLLATDPALTSTPPDPDARDDSTRWRRRLRRLPEGAQVLLCSPCCDPLVVDAVNRLEAAGHPVTLLSPDPTTVRTLGTRLARVHRTVHLADLRRRGVPVIEWSRTDSIDAAVARAGGSRR